MPYVYTRKVQFYETDAMGVVHHSNYIRWFEEARVGFMEDMGFGYDRLNDLGVDIAVTGVNCEYLSMTRFGQTVTVRARLAVLSHARMTVRYAVSDAASGALRVTGETRHGFLSREANRPVALKKAVPELYALFAGKLEPDE
ncbi:MAG: acyl-CoA thioesterase [Oscillospiraceae bacterium]|nr:acyl-CoA thioesterase [Oscillospiraceae bacterium]